VCTTDVSNGLEIKALGRIAATFLVAVAVLLSLPPKKLSLLCIQQEEPNDHMPIYGEPDQASPGDTTNTAILLVVVAAPAANNSNRWFGTSKQCQC
jgi:hypothetical protein